MKQSAAKTLGVAALGAAFAAVGAGAANAAPAVPEAGQALGTVTHSVPAQKVSGALPVASGALATGHNALGSGLAAARPSLEQALAGGPAAPVHNLIGGLPAGQALPGQGVGLNGLPLN
ncbi:ATP-binding protein [Streptomyces sp. NPDC005925]|uniref:ATP-binding protein n=1 Tax=Streptomyces sp. NPDC005925 TaxID=3157172 RepID=UPI0033C14279